MRGHFYPLYSLVPAICASQGGSWLDPSHIAFGLSPGLFQMWRALLLRTRHIHFYCLAQHNGLSAQGGAPPAHGLSHASAQEKACRLWCLGSIDKKLSRASRTTVLSSAFFAQVQKRPRDTRLDNKAGDIMSKENFTLKVHAFNTVLRFFYAWLGDRRKGKAMVKTNPRTKLWFRARISYLSPMFMEKSPMFFGKTPTF